MRRSKIGKITGMVADAPTMESLRKRYGAVGGWGITAGKVEILLGVSGLDLDRSEEDACQHVCQVSRKDTWEGEMVQINRTR